MATTALSVRMQSPEFAALPVEERASVLVWEKAMNQIDTAKNKSAVCREWSARNGHRRGWSADRIWAKYHGWVASGKAWTFLVNWAKVPKVLCDERRGQVQALKRYAEDNQRVSSEGFKAFLRDLRRGKEIAGIGTWRDLWIKENPGVRVPERCPADWTPDGFSRRSMYRKGRLTCFETAATRIGMTEARQYAPPVYSTRVGLEPGRIYQFDDVWHDVLIAVAGTNRKLVRPLEFCCVDVASTHKIGWGLKPQVMREDGTRQGLCKNHFKALICHILCNVGWHKDGCVFCIEHGTASLTPAEQEMITRMTDGSVTFRTSEILGRQIHKGMFHGQGHGNFKAKALVESSHRLIHYAAAALPAQTGGNSRVDEPEQLYGLKSYADKILALYNGLQPDVRESLWFGGALPFVSYKALATELYKIIYDRRDHDIEGWEQNEWVQMMWSITGRDNWQSAADVGKLDAAGREAAQIMLRTPGHYKVERLSPLEVWERWVDADRLQRLPPWAPIDFLGDDFYHEVKVNANNLLVFQDKELTAGSKQELRFMSVIVQPDGSGAQLTQGVEYGVYVLPHDLTKAVIVDPTNRVVLGVAPAWSSVNPLNQDQVGVMVEAQARMIALQAAPIRERHADQAAAFEERKGANDLLLEGLTVPKKVGTAKRQQGEKRTTGTRTAMRALASARVEVTTTEGAGDEW